MKRIVCILAALTLVLAIYAEKRIYFFRAKDLPTDVETIDLRPDMGLTQLTLNNIYADPEARYALFNKNSDSWWQVMVETAKGKTVNLSEVDNTWYLKLKIRRTVDYTLTLVLAGAGTANGYPLPVSQLPANGEWTELSIPLKDLPVLPELTEKYSGRLLQIHSDAGYTGDIVGIDYCYLTNDPSGVDEGTVQSPKRYYFITNSKTPLSGMPYAIVDYSAQMTARAQGWMQWSYIPFPYYSMDADMPVVQQLQYAAPCSMSDVNDDWYIIAQIRTNVEGTFAVRLYLPDGKAYADTIAAGQLVRDGSTWNTLTLPFDRMYPYTYSETTDVLLSLASVGNASAGEWTMASLMLTNDPSIADPQPAVPADPSQESRIYLLNDGSPLPAAMTCTDYRLDQTDYLSIGYGNNTTRKSADAFLTLLPTNGWWSADIAAKSAVDLTAVDDTWTMHTRIRTTSTYRPINLILYKEGNAQLARYQLTETLLPVAQNGNWYDFDIPMIAFLATGSTLISYTSRIFSFHSDGGGTSGVEVSMEYLYFSKEGESRPDPQPTLPPVAEPELEPVQNPDGLFYPAVTPARKYIRNGLLVIQHQDEYFDVLGRPLTR